MWQRNKHFVQIQFFEAFPQEHNASESQIFLTAHAGRCPSLVLLGRVAFDTVNYSVLLDCLHDCADVIPSLPKLLRQRSNSHLQQQKPVIARPLIQSAVHFCSVNAFGLWYVNIYVSVMLLFTYLTRKGPRASILH